LLEQNYPTRGYEEKEFSKRGGHGEDFVFEEGTWGRFLSNGTMSDQE
jgi:hypothetical protein